ncbi:MAG: hypothetical protein U0V87_04190 [Acidobacteriota bacterium]
MRRPLLILLLLLLSPTRALADALPLPISTVLDFNSVEIELRGGRVDVVIDPNVEEPSLEATDYVDSTAARGFLVLEPGANGALHIGQAYGEDAVAPRVLLKLVLRPDQLLAIKGSDLAISIEDLRGLDTDDTATDATKPRSASTGSTDALNLMPNDSDVHLAGVGSATLSGQRTRYRLERTHGQVRAQLKRGSLESTSHRGNIDVSGSDAEVRVTSLIGLLATHQDGGSVVVRDGSGTLELAIDAPNVCEISGFAGAVSLNVKHGAARLERSGTTELFVSLLGTQTDVEIEDLPGRLNLQLTDGGLKLRGVQGPVTVAAEGTATLELRELLDGLELRTQAGVESTVHGVQKRFTARVRDGKLKAEAIGDIDLVANNAQVSIQEITVATRLDVVDSDADLDLSGAQGFPTVKSMGRSRTRLVLRDPCLVRLDGEIEALRDQLQVDGCELIGGRDAAPSMQRRVNAQPPQIITASVGDDAELSVRARP